MEYSTEELTMMCCLGTLIENEISAMTSDDCFECRTQQIPQNQLQHYCLNFGLEISCDVYFERAYHKVKQKPYHILSIFELCTEKIQINRSEICIILIHE